MQERRNSIANALKLLLSCINLLICQLLIILKFCPEQPSDTAVVCAKFLKDWTTERDTCIIHGRDFVRFELRMSLGWISYIVSLPGSVLAPSWA